MRKKPGPKPNPNLVGYVTYPCVYSLANYMALANLMDTGGLRNWHREKASRNRSLVVRKALDLGFRVVQLQILPYQARLSGEVKASSTNLRPVHIEKIAKLAEKGYSKQLAFNLVLEAGIIELEKLRHRFNERRRIVKHD